MYEESDAVVVCVNALKMMPEAYQRFLSQRISSRHVLILLRDSVTDTWQGFLKLCKGAACYFILLYIYFWEIFVRENF